MTETDQSQTKMLEENLARSANAPEPPKVPTTAAYAFLFEKIRNYNQTEMQWNASFFGYS